MTQFFELSSMFSNPTALLPNNEHQKLLQEFERVKESENGWKDCTQLLVSDQQVNDQTKFFCMQIIENYLKTRYTKSTSDDQNLLKQFMSTWLQMQITRQVNEKNFLTRKAAQLFALVSLIDFPSRWPTYFNDLMQTCRWSLGNADFYLKVLLAIDCEIVDREIPRTPEENNLITFYKDSIRQHCVNDLVESWFCLLEENTFKNPEITCQTLEVIGAYISWIEINLIVNNRFMEFFKSALGHVDLRESTCACLEDIVNKGMDISAKLKLIDYLWVNVIQLHASLEQQKLNDDADNCDYLLKFGKLLNAIGENLFDGWQKVNKKDPNTGFLIFQCLESKLPFVLYLLNHTDDDISECVTEYCMHYISLLKVNKIQNREQQANIESMFKIVINKTKYDTSFNFENEGEEEAMFLEFRKNIKLVFDSIAQLDNDFALATVKTYVLEITSNWQMKSFTDIENALYLLYLLGEAIPSSQGNHFQARTHKSDCLSEMIQSTISCNLIQNPHRIVKFQYFENLVRYFRFFQLYPQFIEPVIDHFIGVHGLHNPDPKLRSRCAYLFSRFTKDLKNLVSTYVEKILNTIQDLLIIWSPLNDIPKKDNQIIKNKSEVNCGLLSSDDQLFLYETVSVLIVSCNLQASVKAQLMKNLLAPTITFFSALLTKYCAIPVGDEKTKLVYANCLNTAMLVASRASKGFSNQIKVKDCECVEIFIEILRIFMAAVEINTHKSLISAGLRQYLHRMVVCLDNEILEYLPLIVQHLIKNSTDPKDLYDLMPLINQILNKYKQQIVPFMRVILMPLVETILNFVNSAPVESITQSNILKITPLQLTNATAIVPTTSTAATSTNRLAQQQQQNGDLSIDAQFVLDTQLLYKSYFQFMLNIVNNDLMDIITTQEVTNMYKLFYTLIQGAQHGTLDIIKICFQVIRKFITVFVDKPHIDQNRFVQYTTENIVPCCFQNFIKTVDLNDAQQVLVFNEIGSCLNLLYSKFGDDFLKYLELTYLPSLQLNPQVIQAIIQTIKANNSKGLKTIRESLPK